MNIQVSADGHVHVGKNEWVSLEKIQQAVLNRQNPALNANCPDGECPHCRQQRMTDNEEDHLPLPTMNFRKDDQREVPTINRQHDSEEHLIPPSTARPLSR
ncbi:MAG: hypothetical protein WD738_21380 [Pirellulales bacterium]